MTKVCGACKEEKPLESFHWRNKSKGWLTWSCSECRKAYQRAHAATDAGRASLLARKEKWRAANRRYNSAYYAANVNTERARKKTAYLADPTRFNARSRAYYAANKEKHRATCRAWHERNRERVTAYQAAWVKAHASLVNEKTRKRRALKRGATIVRFSLADLDARMSVFGYRCAYCDGPFQEIDHVKPLARGGPHCLSNLRPSCSSCNRRKWARTPAEWERINI